MGLFTNSVLLVLDHFNEIRNSYSRSMHAAFPDFGLNLFVNCFTKASCNIGVRGKLFLQLHGNQFFHCTVSRFFTAW